MITIDPQPFDLMQGFLNFGVAFLIFLGIGLIFGFGIAAIVGGQGLRIFVDTLKNSVLDLVKTSPRRVLAVAQLTFREAVRRKTLAVFVVFILLFMFAGWFVPEAVEKPELQVKTNVSFMLRLASWLTIFVMLLLSCWGLPEDIKARSLHTVVTKPTRKNEVLMGRILGFVGIGTLMLGVMGVMGYVWIQRQVPADFNLICRVPVYGTLSFTDVKGEPTEAGVNTGDVWDFRSYIQGNTKASAIFKYDGVVPQKDQLKLEARFEAFRTHKGRIGETIRGQVTFINEESGKEYRHPKSFSVREYREGGNVILVDRNFTYIDTETNESRQCDFYDEVVNNGKLTAVVHCIDSGQYIGMARPDLFISLPPRHFASGYFKALFAIWLMMSLVVMLGVTASTFVKGPVATLLTFGALAVGLFLRDFAEEIVDDKVAGSGALESAIRLVKQMNPTSNLGDGAAATAARAIDAPIENGLWLVLQFIPDFRPFQLSIYPANGFDVPFNAGILPSLAVVLAFTIPCLILGYFSLSLRELESK